MAAPLQWLNSSLSNPLPAWCANPKPRREQQLKAVPLPAHPYLLRVNKHRCRAKVDDEDSGEPISLGTAKLPADVDVPKLEMLLFQWANSLTQNANVPLGVPLKVDKVQGGVRLSYIRVNEGVVEDLVHIDAIISSTASSSQPVFQAQRSGKLKNSVPPGEPAIMRGLLQALRTSVDLARLPQ